MKRFEPHSHTVGSNLRLLDCINKPEDLVQKAIDIGLNGIAITDHEFLGMIPKAFRYMEQIQEKYPDFKLAAGNEIYLCKNRESGQKYFHFILIAKNKIGWRALRELSSRAWLNSYRDRGMERVVTTYDDLKEIVDKYPNSLIATSACLGGELSTNTLLLCESEQIGDNQTATAAHSNIVNFILFCKELFGNDFYIECAPGCSKEQIIVNKRLVSIANTFNIKMVIGSDAHYLTKEDRYVHESYLNSKGGEREVASFYEYAYLQTENEIIKHLSNSISTEIEKMFDNSMEIYNKIERYSIWHNQTIPKVEVKNYEKMNWWGVNNPISDEMENYKELKRMFCSDDKYERYWVNQCWNKLKNIFNCESNIDLINNHSEYISRLEEEAETKKIIGDKLGANIFAYPITLQHYINMFWESGSMVGAGRGSSCSGLNHYLLGVTQLDPIQWNLPWYRYLNKDRAELPDIDLDLCPSKRPKILKNIKMERSQNFIDNLDERSKEELGCVLVATFGTETTKSAIQTACRGYRSKEYPEGIDSDTSAYLSSLVPVERGFVWSCSDIYNGNKEKGRKPVQLFINEVNQYQNLIDIIFGIEGVINKRSSHASGVIMSNEDPYEFLAYMKTPKGEVITQFDLHDCEAMGATKYDFLVTEVQDKLTKCIELLQEFNEINKNLSLKEVYDKYFHPSVLPIEDDKIWEVLHNNSVLNIFQFDSPVGAQAAKKIKPRSILEMSDSNGLMRLMTAEKGEETPMDKYVRFKNNIDLWYREMTQYGLTEKEQEILKPYFLKSHGVPPSQEQMMEMLMDENICNFSLKDANNARKIVGKKKMDKIPALREQVLQQAKSPCLGNYIWKCGIGPQMGYSFSKIHALAYSFIGFQTMYIATEWNPIYWNTACLIVNSGALDENSNTQTDYGKIAKALGDIISRGIKVSLVDINKSDFGFIPDVNNNTILFGMKALNGIGTPIIEAIKGGRPYKSFKDFLQRCPLNKTAMISLIKAGAFDNLEQEWAKETGIEARVLIMGYYLSLNCDAKKRLTLQNFNGLLQENLIGEELDFEKRIFNFNKYLKAYKKVGQYFVFDEICYTFFEEKLFQYIDVLEVINGHTCILQKEWEKIYKTSMDNAREYLKENQKKLLNEYNTLLFNKAWNKYAKGNLSKWEMDSLCFYYHEHELKNINTTKYGLVDFEDLPEEPEIEKFFVRNGKNIPIYKTYKIVGTVIDKNDTKSSVTIITPSKKVVTIKFTKDYYAMFGRQLSEKQSDGTKKIVEKGWFSRGTKIMCTGFRRDDQFVTKTYKHTQTHQLYKIENVYNNGDLKLTHERYKVQGE